jgi:hypothetical protein
MARDTRGYDDAVDESESTLRDPEDFSPLDVRCIEREARMSGRRTYTYLVVNHDAGEVLHEGSPVRQTDVAPSVMSEAAKAEGIAVGWLLAHPDHEWL